MGSAFHQLCPRYSGTLTPTAPTVIRLWDTFTFTLSKFLSLIKVWTLLIYRFFLRDKSVQSSIPNYFKNCEVPIICYKYKKPIRGAIFNFNKLVSDLEIETCTPDS